MLWEKIYSVCDRLWDSEDPDCKEAEEYGFKEDIMMLFSECYTAEDFLQWLTDHDFNPAYCFRSATIVNRVDCDEAEWEEACNNSLFFNENFACTRW